MSTRSASLLAACRAAPSLVPSPDAFAYERLRRALCEAIRGADTPLDLIRVIIALPIIENIDETLSATHRDYLLRLNARVHGKALVELSRWYSAGQIDAGMEALAARMAWLAEPKHRRMKSPAAIRELLFRVTLFRNLLENLVLAEALTADVADDERASEIVRLVGTW
jgi:hypothetical protein